MKIAGSKNDGKWFRTNRAIQGHTTNSGKTYPGLTDAERANLAGCIGNGTELINYHAALLDMANTAGVAIPDFPATPADLAKKWCDDGIPRQVWMGVLSWDVYSKGDDGKYYADHTLPARLMGKKVRNVCKLWFLARRQLNDTGNRNPSLGGNPGLLPDTNAAT